MLLRLDVLMKVLVVATADPAMLVIRQRHLNIDTQHADVTSAKVRVFLQGFLSHLLDLGFVLDAILHFRWCRHYHKVFICTLMKLMYLGLR